MSISQKLELTNVEQPPTNDPITSRRVRLISSLDRQIHLIQAKLDGIEGDAKRKPVTWYWMGGDGTYYCAIKYAKRRLEIAKGKTAIHGKTLDDIQSALKIAKDYVRQGDFDKQLDEVAIAVRKNFKK
ncbi:MAG: hypothetical protein JKY17_01950 [Magnetovibrio sp.]|nr:hypothetical protein [Magnetovibrio sp.]